MQKVDEETRNAEASLPEIKSSSTRSYIALAIISLINLVNFSERYILSSVLIELKSYFRIGNSQSGLLQTGFLLTFMLVCPLFGYLGDKYSRKTLITFSLIVHLASVVLGSLVNQDQFLLFIASRCAFGVATGAFICIEVSLIADLFQASITQRTRAFLIFNLGPPLGVGVGYLCGIVAKEIRPDRWQMSMRILPIAVLVLLVAVILFMREPQREKHKSTEDSAVSYWTDFKALLRNKPYLCVVFCNLFSLATISGFNWWLPTFNTYLLKRRRYSDEDLYRVEQIYSVLTSVVGMLGAVASSEISNLFQKRLQRTADAYIAAVSLSVAAVSLFVYVFLAEMANIYVVSFFYALFVLGVNFNWVLIANMLLACVEPRLRSTANALSLTLLHLVGDSISPYWIGLIVDGCLGASRSDFSTFSELFYCTQNSLYPLAIVTILAAASALFYTIFVPTRPKIKPNVTQ